MNISLPERIFVNYANLINLMATREESEQGRQLRQIQGQYEVRRYQDYSRPQSSQFSNTLIIMGYWHMTYDRYI